MKYKEKGYPKEVAEAALDKSWKYIPYKTGYTMKNTKMKESHRTNSHKYTLISPNPSVVYDTVQKYPRGGRYKFEDSPNRYNRDKFRWFERGMADVGLEKLRKEASKK